MAEFYFVATDKNDALAYACEMDIPVNNLWKCAEKEHYVCQFNSVHIDVWIKYQQFCWIFNNWERFVSQNLQWYKQKKPFSNEKKIQGVFCMIYVCRMLRIEILFAAHILIAYWSRYANKNVRYLIITSTWNIFKTQIICNKLKLVLIICSHYNWIETESKQSFAHWESDLVALYTQTDNTTQHKIEIRTHVN